VAKKTTKKKVEKEAKAVAIMPSAGHSIHSCVSNLGGGECRPFST
jgi:hypothetical protein